MSLGNEATAIRGAGNDIANLLLGMALFGASLILFLTIPQDEIVAYVSSNAISGYSLSSVVAGDIANNIGLVFGILEVSTLAYALIVIAKSMLCLTYSITDKALKVVSCFQNIFFWVSSIVASSILMLAVLYFFSAVGQNLPALAAVDKSVVELADSISSVGGIIAMLISFAAEITITAMGLANTGDSQIVETAKSLNRVQPLLWVMFIISPPIAGLVFGFACVLIIAAVTAILNAILMALFIAVMAGTLFVVFICDIFRL